jgi:hypothetical protein
MPWRAASAARCRRRPSRGARSGGTATPGDGTRAATAGAMARPRPPRATRARGFPGSAPTFPCEMCPAARRLLPFRRQRTPCLSPRAARRTRPPRPTRARCVEQCCRGGSRAPTLRSCRAPLGAITREIRHQPRQRGDARAGPAANGKGPGGGERTHPRARAAESCASNTGRACARRWGVMRAAPPPLSGGGGVEGVMGCA